MEVLRKEQGNGDIDEITVADRRGEPLLFGRRADGLSYRFEGAFPASVDAGFTTSALKGDTLSDIPRVLDRAPAGIGIAWMKQVHGPEVLNVEEPGSYQCDGLFSHSAGLTLVVRTADCLPLIFYSSVEKVAGVIHMGWRSAESGILENIGFDLSSFVCVAGVGLRSCCYRVGEDFSGRDRVMGFVKKAAGSCYFDPIEFARRYLVSRGLREENFYDTGICSYCSDAAHHSYRRTGTADRTLTFTTLSTGGGNG